MKKPIIIALTILLSSFYSCKSEISEKTTSKDEEVHVDPLVHFEKVDAFLAELAGEPQKFKVSSDTLSIVTGKNGTIINVDPNSLETVDGSPIGKEIDVKLVEMVTLKDFLTNNAQTVSNGEVIETGGAYDITMFSDGKELKIKNGKSIQVEFPRISEKDMEVFMGERDSLGQVNWEATGEDFKKKDLAEPEKPSRTIAFSINGSESEKTMTDKEYEQYLKSNKGYLKRMGDIERKNRTYKRKNRTYEAINILDLGLCNVDRFRTGNTPNTNIIVKLKNTESIEGGVRVFAVYNEFNGILSQSILGNSDKTTFYRVPVSAKMNIIALSADDYGSYFYETTINTTKNASDTIEINLAKMSAQEIEERMLTIKGID